MAFSNIARPLTSSIFNHGDEAFCSALGGRDGDAVAIVKPARARVEIDVTVPIPNVSTTLPALSLTVPSASSSRTLAILARITIATIELAGWHVALRVTDTIATPSCWARTARRIATVISVKLASLVVASRLTDPVCHLKKRAAGSTQLSHCTLGSTVAGLTLTTSI